MFDRGQAVQNWQLLTKLDFRVVEHSPTRPIPVYATGLTSHDLPGYSCRNSPGPGCSYATAIDNTWGENS